MSSWASPIPEKHTPASGGTPTGSSARAYLGRSLVSLGDSLSAAGNTTPEKAALQRYEDSNTRSFALWACLLSGGRLQYRGAIATAGYTSQQIRDTLLPKVLALDPKPAMCTVLAGRNPDVGGLATTIANLTAIYNELEAAGITPVPCTVPPADWIGNPTDDHRLIVWISAEAERRGLPFADFYSPLVGDRGDWGTTAGGTSYAYETDANAKTHQSDAGAKVMGAALWDALDPLVPATPTFLAARQDADDTTLLFPNSLFLDDSDGNGVPDSCGGGGLPDATSTLTTDANMGKGKVWTVTRKSGEPATYLDTIAVPDGHHVLVSTKLAVSVQDGDANSGTVDLSFYAGNYSAILATFSFHRDVPAGSALAFVLKVPAGVGGIKPLVMLKNGVSSLSLSQLTVVDLDA